MRLAATTDAQIFRLAVSKQNFLQVDLNRVAVFSNIFNKQELRGLIAANFP